METIKSHQSIPPVTTKNLKLQEKINLYLCNEEQLNHHSLDIFDCFVKVRNYRELSVRSIEAKPDGNSLTSIEPKTPSVSTSTLRANLLTTQAPR